MEKFLRAVSVGLCILALAGCSGVPMDELVEGDPVGEGMGDPASEPDEPAGGPDEPGGDGSGDADNGPGGPGGSSQVAIGQDQQLVAPEFDLSAPARNWNQFQGDARNHGFMPVRTTTSMKWRAEVGHTAYGSPVVGPDDTVYVGTYGGELVALSPDGTERWRRAFFPGSRILSTPAIDASGDIYVVTSEPEDDETFSSILNKVSPQGDWLWATGDVGFSTASPSIHGSYIFLPFVVSTDGGGVYRRLFVFDTQGREVTSTAMGGCSNTVCGHGPDILGALWDALTSVWDFISDLPPCGIPCKFDPSGSLDFELEQVWLDPTTAVLSYPGDAPGDPPLVIGVNNFCMTAFRFEDEQLNRIWSRRLVGDDCDDPFAHSSPAVFATGMLVLGSKRGYVRAFDALTGEKLWTYDADAGVKAVAASLGRQVYVVAGGELHYLDYNGELLDTLDLGGESMASPVLSASSVILSVEGAVRMMGLDLSGPTSDHRVSGGFSAAAIARDGTVYIATPGGELIAYGEIDEPPSPGALGGTGQMAPAAELIGQ